MKSYLIECAEINYFTIEVDAESMDEAAEKRGAMLFHAINTSGTGKLTKEEFFSGLELGHLEMTEELMQFILGSMDIAESTRRPPCPWPIPRVRPRCRRIQSVRPRPPARRPPSQTAAARPASPTARRWPPP